MTRRSPILLLLVALLWQSPAQAQIDSANVWVTTALPGGPYTVNFVAVDPTRTDTVYAGTAPGTIFRSLDRSITWAHMPAAMGTIAESVLSIAFNPKNPDVVYAGGALSGVFRSVDRGANWTLTPLRVPPLPTFPANVLVVDPVDTSRIYAGTSAELHLSTDDGTTWAVSDVDTALSFSVQAIVVLPDTPDTVLVSNTGAVGVYRSTDRGVTFTVSNTGLTNTTVTGLAASSFESGVVVATTLGGGAFRSSDGGLTWTAQNAGIGNLSLESITVSPSSPNVIYVGSSAGEVYESTDAGQNWNDITFALANANPVNAIAVHPDSANIVYIGIDKVYRIRQAGLDSVSFVQTAAVPAAVHAVDLNADGAFDLVAANAGTQMTSILLNGSQGSAFSRTDLSTGAEPTSVQSGDLDGDGDFDVVVGHRTQQTLAILFNDSTGAFSSTTEIFVGMEVAFVALADYDTDGDIDVAATDDTNGTIFIYMNDGFGSFGAPTTAVGLPAPSAMRADDFTGDGIADLLLTSRSTNEAQLLRNQGNAVFTADPVVSLPASPNALATGDFDIDGDTDFVVSLSDQSVVVSNNAGIGTFSGQAVYTNTDTSTSVLASDIDQDGYADLVAPAGDGNITVFVNNANGLFTTTALFGTQAGVGPAAMADLSGDGIPDGAFSLSTDNGLLLVANLFPQNIKAPAPPRNLVAADTQGDLGGRVTLTWHRPNVDETTGRITQYNVFRATDVAGPYTLHAAVDTMGNNTRDSTFVNRTYIDSTATVGATFHYYIVSRNEAGAMSASSDTVSASSLAQPFYDFQFSGNSPFHIQDTVSVTVRLNPMGLNVQSLSLFVDFDTRAFTIVDNDAAARGIQPFVVDSVLTTQRNTLTNQVDTSTTSGTGKLNLTIGVSSPDPSALSGTTFPVAKFRVISLRDTTTRMRVVDEMTTIRRSAITDTDGNLIRPFISSARTIILRNHKVRGHVKFQGRSADVDYGRGFSLQRGLQRTGVDMAARFDLTQHDSSGTGTPLPDSLSYNPPNDADQNAAGIQLTLNEDGSFTLLQVPGGTYGLFVKTFHYLRARISTDSLVVNDSTGVAGSVAFRWIGIDTSSTELRAGDANDDNQVDLADFGILGANFGEKVLSEGTAPWSADFNGDGAVNIGDFAVFQPNFGEVGMGPQVATKAIASPAALDLWVDGGGARTGVILASNLPPVTGYAFDLVSDKAAMDLKSLLIAESLFHDRDPLTLARTIDRDDQTVLRLAAVLPPHENPVSGDGVLFTFDPSQLPEDAQIERVRFLTPDGHLIFGQGTIPEMIHIPRVLRTLVYQNIPNPFNPETVIPYDLREPGDVCITLYSALGQEILVLVDAFEPAGRHQARWDGRDRFGRQVASGLYFYRFEAPGVTSVKKAILLR